MYWDIDTALEHQNVQIALLSEQVSHLRFLENDSIRYSPRCSLGQHDGSFNEVSVLEHGDDWKETKCEVTLSVTTSTAAAVNAMTQEYTCADEERAYSELDCH